VRDSSDRATVIEVSMYYISYIIEEVLINNNALSTKVQVAQSVGPSN